MGVPVVQVEVEGLFNNQNVASWIPTPDQVL